MPKTILYPQRRRKAGLTEGELTEAQELGGLTFRSLRGRKFRCNNFPDLGVLSRGEVLTLQKTVAHFRPRRPPMEESQEYKDLFVRYKAKVTAQLERQAAAAAAKAPPIQIELEYGKHELRCRKCDYRNHNIGAGGHVCLNCGQPYLISYKASPKVVYIDQFTDENEPLRCPKCTLRVFRWQVGENRCEGSRCKEIFMVEFREYNRKRRSRHDELGARAGEFVYI